MITALRRFFARLLAGLVSIISLRLIPVNKTGMQSLTDPERDANHAGQAHHRSAG